MVNWLSRARSYLRSAIWLLPVTCVLVGATLSFGTLALDRRFDHEALPESLVGGPDAALGILQTVATSMVSLAALVLTITMVVVQLAMAQFSPRIVQRVLQDKPSQLAIGLFVATFVHALLTLREVVPAGDGEPGKVPGLSVLTAFLLVLASIAVLVIYVHHIGRSLRVSALIELVGKDTRALIDRRYPGLVADRDREDAATLARSSGVITAIGTEQLVELARRADCRLELLFGIGEFVAAGAPLFRVHGDRRALDVDRVHGALMLALERTLEHDVGYGLRMLVDIAVRSLADSPFQDPTTTVQAIDRIHDLMRQLIGRQFDDGQHRDAQGTVRLCVPTMSWEAYVHLAFDEVRMAGTRSPQVTRRLTAALVDLSATGPDDRRPPLDAQLAKLRSGVQSAVDEGDHALSLAADRAGIGAAAASSPSKRP